MLTPERNPNPATGTLGIGAAVIALACCAGLPAVGALLGGLTVGAVLGLGFGALLLAALAWAAAAIIVRRQRVRRTARSEQR
jgi:hypothetical protein